jgi:Zn-dependent protease
MFLLGLSPFEMFAWVVSFLVALSVHEAAHAFATDYLGDPTARYAGRVTLNPLAHLDPAGTLFLLFAGFGWGRPVPINPANFRSPRAGAILTSLAGPLSNLALALLLAIPYNFLLTPETSLWLFVQTAMYLNVILLVFNLIPLFPLDGGNAVAPLLSPRVQAAFYQYGPFVLFGLIATDFAFKTHILWNFLNPAIDIVWTVVNLATTFGVR